MKINQIPRTISETMRSLPVIAAYDVVVAGGGIAGVAAAVAAARLGVSLCLLEKQCAPGGLATLGNVSIWLPICDGRGHQVIGGSGTLPHGYRPGQIATYQGVSRTNRSLPWVEKLTIIPKVKNRSRT